jgi:small subunit ribosomal protein S6
VRKYEYVYILDPQEENTKNAIEDIKMHYNEMGVRILKEEDMGKRRLAYEIDKKTDGYYYVTQIEIDDFSKLEDFEKEMRLSQDVIRFMKVII